VSKESLVYEVSQSHTSVFETTKQAALEFTDYDGSYVDKIKHSPFLQF
jgi:hypothetical protein